MTKKEADQLLKAVKQACRAFADVVHKCDDPPKSMFKAWERIEELLYQIEGKVQ